MKKTHSAQKVIFFLVVFFGSATASVGVSYWWNAGSGTHSSIDDYLKKQRNVAEQINIDLKKEKKENKALEDELNSIIVTVSQPQIRYSELEKQYNELLRKVGTKSEHLVGKLDTLSPIQQTNIRNDINTDTTNSQNKNLQNDEFQSFQEIGNHVLRGMTGNVPLPQILEDSQEETNRFNEVMHRFPNMHKRYALELLRESHHNVDECCKKIQDLGIEPVKSAN